MLFTRTVPLVWQGEMKGILSIFSSAPEAFGEDKIRVLNILANEGIIALQNVRMFTNQLNFSGIHNFCDNR